MEVILNIGLAVGTDGNIDQGTVLREMAAVGLTPTKFRTYLSDTEETIVATINLRGTWGWLRDVVNCVAVLTGQDCIAVYCRDLGRGELIGPRAAEWGPFNPEYFLQLNGTRLAALPRAA